jgi:hypothetical protein
MARKPKLISNGYDAGKLKDLLQCIDTNDAELASLKSNYMTKCKAPRGALAEVFEEAEDAGFPKRAFRTLVKNHRLNRRIKDNAARLEADDHDSYERLVESLGDFIDLPLGQAAAERARPTMAPEQSPAA